MDMWTIDENANIAREKPEKRQDCVAAMLYACQRNELDTCQMYTHAKEKLCDIFGVEKEDNAICKMLCNMIAVSNDRAASFAKAAALIQGYSAPKATDYDKAVK